MTEIEMAEEYCNNEVPFDTTESGEKLYTENDLKHAFLAGLNESRPQWHDVRKNPNDLPDDTYDVLDQAGYKVHYNFFQNVWVNEKDEIDEHVIAWCEIPQFEE